MIELLQCRDASMACAVIREDFPSCLYVHCTANALALCHSCQVQSIRNFIGVVTSIETIFRGSAQRLEVLTILLLKKYQAMLSMCATRWVEI